MRGEKPALKTQQVLHAQLGTEKFLLKAKLSPFHCNTLDLCTISMDLWKIFLFLTVWGRFGDANSQEC